MMWETIDFSGDMYGDDAELNLSDGTDRKLRIQMLTPMQRLWKWEQMLITSKKEKIL